MKTTSFLSTLWAGFVVVAITLCHCGGDDAAVTGTNADAGGGDDSALGNGDAQLTGTCGSIATACTAAAQCCVDVCTSGSCGGPGKTADGAPGPNACNTAGGPCAKGFDCCSGTCNGGQCIGSVLGANPDGGSTSTGSLSCGIPTADCKVSSDCCSGVCEPVTGEAGVIQCRDACRANGVACVTAQDCCSLGCFGGVCTAQECIEIGQNCTTNQDCCSGVCDTADTHECVVDIANSTCRPTGENCGSGPQSGCCGATPDNDLCVEGRCGFPPGACKGLHATCAADGDCCDKHCDLSTHTCLPAVACTPTAGACVTGADCCTSSCTNGSCDAPIPPGGGGTLPDGGTATCEALGTSCAASAQCCSGLCLAGFCDFPPR